MSALRTWWNTRSSRSRALIGGAATVVLLAAVILGVSALSAPKSTENTTAEITTEQQSQLAYEKGMTELRAGETTAAIESFERALALDPNNTQASEALADAQQTPGDNSSAGDDGGTAVEPEGEAPEPEPEDPAFSKPVDDLTVLLPTRAEGFALGSAVAVDRDATVSGSPNTPEAIASRALWSVHDRKTAKGAAKFLKSVSKSLYPEDADTISVDGVEAYFGHDGERFATIAFVRGRYAFEVVLTTLTGSPEELRTEAENAASAFPDSIED